MTREENTYSYADREGGGWVWIATPLSLVLLYTIL